MGNPNTGGAIPTPNTGDGIRLDPKRRRPLELWAIVCGHGEVHVGEECEAYLDKEHAEEGLCIVSDYEEECGPHKIVKFREVAR